MSFTSALDPLTPTEVGAAADILRKHHSKNKTEIRFKVIDLQEPAKAALIGVFAKQSSSPTALERKARVYYHTKSSHVLAKAIVNITTGTVELDEEHPDAQGPVDWTEFEQVHDACNSHPAVLAEIEKLKLPSG